MLNSGVILPGALLAWSRIGVQSRSLLQSLLLNGVPVLLPNTGGHLAPREEYWRLDTLVSTYSATSHSLPRLPFPVAYEQRQTISVSYAPDVNSD